MAIARTIARFDTLELHLCRWLNNCSRHAPTCRLFSTVSRLGNGLFWYSLMLTLALVPGEPGREAAIQMGLTALVGVLLYKMLKESMVRERPFITHRGIVCATAPLDRYSFPSGHTLQAVLFSTIAVAWFPALVLLLLPTVILIALSRVVLGLHYPTDVLVGAFIGWALAATALWVYPPVA